jgi:hypothetical protein
LTPGDNCSMMTPETNQQNQPKAEIDIRHAELCRELDITLLRSLSRVLSLLREFRQYKRDGKITLLIRGGVVQTWQREDAGQLERIS